MHKELGDRPVCDRKTLSPSTTPSQVPHVAFLVSHLPSVNSQALGSPLRGTKRSSPTPSPPTRVMAGMPAWEPQEARILLESSKSLNGQAPGARPKLPNIQDERKGALEHTGCLSTNIAVANYFPITATVFRQSIKGAKVRLTLLPLLPKARKSTSEAVWGPVYTSHVAWEFGDVIPLVFWSPGEFCLCFCTTSAYSQLSQVMNQRCLLGFQGIKRIP